MRRLDGDCRERSGGTSARKGVSPRNERLGVGSKAETCGSMFVGRPVMPITFGHTRQNWWASLARSAKPPRYGICAATARVTVSLRLDTGELHHFGPLLCFVGHKRPKLGGRHRHWIGA